MTSPWRRPTRTKQISTMLGLAALTLAIVFTSLESSATIYNRLIQAFYMALGYQGSGGDGALTVDGIPNGPTNPLYTDNVRTYINGATASGQKILNVASSAGFAIGDEVVVIQMLGTNAGQYETGTIASTGAGTITLSANLANSYTAYSAGSQDAQVIRVPQYTSVTINSGGYLTVHAFDGQTGGVMFMRASTGVTVNYNASLSGQISVTGKGFAGGSTSTAGSGLGGGSAGGGGASSLSPSNVTRLIMGGGGGGGSGGAGGNGAGVMAIFTNATITNNGNISANGNSAAGATNGGGGAGGSLWLTADTITTSGTCGNMTVNGGSGNGTGTAGSAGQFIMYYRTSMNCATGAPAANSSYLKYKDK